MVTITTTVHETLHSRPLSSQPFRVEVSGCCRDGGGSEGESVRMLVGVRFDDGGGQQQPCILALPWFLPVSPSITIPLPPSCAAAFASPHMPASSSTNRSSGPIVGSYLVNTLLAHAAAASMTIGFDADVEVGE